MTKTSGRNARRRRGLTLAELLIASTIMLLIATAVATLAETVHSTNDYCKGYTVAAQHARVALTRIERAVQNAIANEQFPGCLVVTEQAGSQVLPSTLVIWNPTTGTVANPTGLPLISEIVVFGPDPAHPNHLIEIRSPTEATAVPVASDMSAWRTLTDRLKTSSTTTKIQLTDRMRTAPLTGNYTDSLTPADLRGAVRFRRLMAPSDTEWGQYRAGTRTWQNIAWPLDSYRSTSGTRAVACQTELQIAPGGMASAAVTAIPFYGSASISYELPR
ncbi:MAG TPA: prepilin-type N-terminal cleavage/methylation domain-containing protein [Pirellulaceae bacterium]|nr:prepilin-type N-terminal cleavage/methylation domain-containing protein [Pirellulaceae bacterium]